MPSAYALGFLPVLLGYLICKGFLDTIPISILFVIMQKFYVEGITSGADKG